MSDRWVFIDLSPGLVADSLSNKALPPWPPSNCWYHWASRKSRHSYFLTPTLGRWEFLVADLFGLHSRIFCEERESIVDEWLANYALLPLFRNLSFIAVHVLWEIKKWRLQTLWCTGLGIDGTELYSCATWACHSPPLGLGFPMCTRRVGPNDLYGASLLKDLWFRAPFP